MKLTKLKMKSSAIAALICTTMLFAGVRTTSAAEVFNNEGIQFDEDTIVDFEFIESHGAYQSSFGVINLDTGEKTPLLVEKKPADTNNNVRRPSNYQDDFESQQANDFLGTPGNTVPQSLASFTFKAGGRYVLYLESNFNNQPAGIVYSTNLKNTVENQQTKFIGDLSQLGNGGVILRWNDTGSKLVQPKEQDIDFDDFSVGVGGNLECPYASAQ